MRSPWWWRILVLPTMLASVLMFVLVRAGVEVAEKNNSFGVNDFVEYWSASHVARGGGNPYDPVEMRRIQRLVDPRFDREPPDSKQPHQPLMMWNPPWTLTLLSPVIHPSFQKSAFLWIAANVFFFVSSIFLTREIGLDGNKVGRRRRWLWIFGLIMLAPAVNALWIGQVGVLLMWASLLLWYLLVRKVEGFAGICAALLTIKPHLFVPLLFVLGWRAVVLRKWRFLLGGVLGLGGLSLYAWSINSNLFFWWWQSMRSPLPGAVAPFQWVTSSPLSVALSGAGLVGRADIPLLLSLLGLLIGIGLALWVSRTVGFDSVQRWFPVVAGTSLLVSPFAWLFDYGLLAAISLPGIFLAFEGESPHPRRRVAALGGLLVPLVGVLFFVPLDQPTVLYRCFSWYAPFMLLWFLASRRILAQQPLHPTSGS